MFQDGTCLAHFCNPGLSDRLSNPTSVARPRSRFTVTDDNLPFVLAALALCGIALVLPAQADTFYHLRSGKAMWDTGWFLTHEPFSYTASWDGLNENRNWFGYVTYGDTGKLTVVQVD